MFLCRVVFFWGRRCCARLFGVVLFECWESRAARVRFSGVRFLKLLLLCRDLGGVVWSVLFSFS